MRGLYPGPVDALEPVPGVGSGGVIPGESPKPMGVDAWGRAAPPPELTPYLQRVNEALESEGAPATKRATVSDWAKFERWCAHRSLTPLPAHPITVCLYLLDHAELIGTDGKPAYALATLRRWVSSINRVHKGREQLHPGADDRVRRVLRSIARRRAEAGHGGQRQAEPVRVDHLRQIIERMNPRALMAGAWDVRDAALLGLGWRCALRRSELVAVRVKDVLPSPDGRWRVRVAASKTDQEGQGQTLALSVTRDPLTCVPCAVVRWAGLLHAATFPRRDPETGELLTEQESVIDYLTGHPDWAAGHVCGPGMPTGLVEGSWLLRPIAPDGVPRKRGMSGAAASNVVRRRAASIGLQASRFSGHSLRAGFVTEASVLGVPGDQIAAQTRHGSLDMVSRYRRVHDPHTGNAEGLLPG